MAWPVNTRTGLMMDEAQALYGATITATQGSPNLGVGASAGTHDGEGVIDVSGADLDAIVYAMRKVGFAAWHRTRAEGFSPHVHGVAVGEPGLSPEAADQVTDYLEGRNGLSTNAPDDGPREFVGQTWEGYLANTPPAGPSRAFRGAQLTTADVVVTAGSLDPYDDILDGIFRRDDAVTVTLTVGDEFYIYLRTAAFESTDVISLINWRFNASGHGTLVLAESVDPGYSYTPPFTWTALGSVVVDTDALALTATPALTHTADALSDNDNPLLLRVTCTSGSVTLDWLCLQVEPPSGFQLSDTDTGHWSEWQSPETFDMPPSYAKLGVLSGGASNNFTDGNPGLPASIDDDMVALGAAAVADLTESWLNNPGSFTALAGNAAFTFWHQPIVLVPSYVHQTSAQANRVIFTAKWETWPTLQLLPDFMSDLVLNQDYARLPGSAGSTFDPLTYGEFQPGDTESVAWNPVMLTAFAQNYWTPLINPTLTAVVSPHASEPGDIWYGVNTVLPVSTDYIDIGPGIGTPTTTHQAGPDAAISWAPPDGDFTLSMESSLGETGDVGPPSGGWEQADGISVEHRYEASVSSDRGMTIQVQMPDYRHWIPGFIRSPDALDTTDPEGVVVTWLRQRQRNDGLGNSITRARGVSSQQNSLRQRGYR